MGHFLCNHGETGAQIWITESLVQHLVVSFDFMAVDMYEFLSNSNLAKLTNKTGQSYQECFILHRNSSWSHYILYNGLYYISECKFGQRHGTSDNSLHTNSLLFLLTLAATANVLAPPIPRV